MKLDRYTARALVDANLMSLREYIDKFGAGTEQDAGKTDEMRVSRVQPAGNRVAKGCIVEARHLASRVKPGLTVTRVHFH